MSTELLRVIAILLVGQLKQSGPPAPTDAAPESVEVRYSRAQLQLAQANLQRVQDINRRLPRSVPASVVADYERGVDVATAQLEQSQAGVGRNEFAVWLRRAEAAWKSGETAWKNAVAANQRSPRTFGALDVERLRLRAEVTRLQWERGQQLAAAPRESQLQWQVDVLNYELERQKEEGPRVAPFIRYYGW
jgi:hypothetical protein